MACDIDLTIEGALRDPVIGAVMRADRVDPKAFEILLRSAKRRIDADRAPTVPGVIAARARKTLAGCAFC